MLCFRAFGNVPYKDVAIMTCRQHYPGIKRMGLQDKYFIRVSLEFKITYQVQTRGHKSTSRVYLQQSPKHRTIISSHSDSWKIRHLRAASKTHGFLQIPQCIYLDYFLMARKQGKTPGSQKDCNSKLNNCLDPRKNSRNTELFFFHRTVNY